MIGPRLADGANRDENRTPARVSLFPAHEPSVQQMPVARRNGYVRGFLWLTGPGKVLQPARSPRSKRCVNFGTERTMESLLL